MKRQKKFKRIGTHNGKFHADEVIATAILKELFEVELTRTRDEKVLKELDIVYDVGGGKFDHHGINKRYRENGTPYAACGLIWEEFGKDLLKLKRESLNNEEIQSIFDYIDKSIIEGADALDNGIWIDKTEIPLLHISSIIEKFNPLWNSNKDENEAFNEAVELARTILNNAIEHKFSVLDAKEHVLKAYKNRIIPELLVLDRYCPYNSYLREIDTKEEVLYTIYPREDSYALQSIRDENKIDKKKLPKAWAGLRGEELAAVTGVPDAIFCHTGRFIAITGTKEGIMKLAKIAIETPKEE
ncbi:MYG1 family protein [Clostridium isatidis]|uniref:MYG1 family protein n=1 Tax=Clostridium isatidis TaxID=182773 RepID=UPI003AB0A039